MRRDRRSGFTLIDAMLGLTLGAVVLLNARFLVGQSAITRQRFETAVAERDRAANGMRMARRLLANAHVGIDSTERAVGTSNRLEIQSWCKMPEGFTHRCRVRLSTSQGAATTSLYVDDGISGAAFVAALVGEASLAYVFREAHHTRWASTWTAREDAPLAVAFASVRDTITFALRYR